MVGAVLMVGVTVTVVTRPRRLWIPVILLLGLSSLATWRDDGGWLGLVGLAVLIIGAVVVVRLLVMVVERTRAAEERYRMLVETASDGIIAVDQDFRITLANEAACQMFGYEIEELVDESLEMLVPEPDREAHRRHVQGYVASGGPQMRMAERSRELRGARKDGGVFPVEIGISRATLSGSSVYTAVVRDVSERRRREDEETREQEQRYRELYERVPIGLYRTTVDGRFLDVNPAFLAMFGFSSREEMLGSSVASLYADPADRVEFLSQVDASTEPVQGELRVLRADGTEMLAVDRSVPIRNGSGEVVHYEGAMRDVTEARRAEAELRGLVQSKTQLIASVSHEIRTPLAAVLGYLDILDSGTDIDPSDRAEFIGIALSQAVEMSSLVEDLLTAARLDNDAIVINLLSVDVTEAAESVVAVIAPITGVDVAIPPGSYAWADPVRLRQILRNLLVNAFRHGLPPVEVECLATSDGTLLLTVSDHGPGVPAGSEERIFEAFRRTDRSRGMPESIGIGLTVARRLARLMGGELFYVRCGDRTCFTLELPSSETSLEGEAA